MLKWISLVLLSAAIFAANMDARTLTPVWVAVGPTGQVVARVVVERPNECPSIQFDNAKPRPMMPRLPVPANLKLACEAVIPPSAKTAKANGQTLVLPVKNPTKITVIGDTGCRLKGDRVQACNDSSAWPFAQIASMAAKSQPQLVMHVGDYLYREESCPVNERGCKGSPWGDNWETWNADFFKPAKDLLKAAPWLMARGNHESCKRAWRGWFYYLDPRPMAAACNEYSAPYLAKLGNFQVLVLDSSEVGGGKPDPQQVAIYRKQLQPFANTPAWMLLHHPFWGLKRGAPGPTAVTETLHEAYTQAGMKKIGFILSGHTHLFELFSFVNGWPPQLVAGDSGTKLGGTVNKYDDGVRAAGSNVKSGDAKSEFGFVELTGSGDQLQLNLKSKVGKVLVNCQLHGHKVTCPN